MDGVRAQSCLTLWDPVVCKPPGSSVHGISRKNIGVGCHFLLQGIFLTQELNLHLLRLLHQQVILYHWCHLKQWKCVSHSVLSDCLRLMDCSLPGSSVHGILQARILGWVAITFSRGSSRLRDRTRVSCIAGRFFTIWATREVVKGRVKTISRWHDPLWHKPPHKNY